MKLGADLPHVVISHVDRCQDIGYNRELLQTGVRVEYDSAFRWKEDTNWTYKLLEALLPDFPDQITMGMDAAKTSYWQSYGGKPGLNFLLTTFKDELQKMGLGQYYEKIFFKNPAQLYSFSKAALSKGTLPRNGAAANSIAYRHGIMMAYPIKPAFCLNFC
jgi:phosphotriesterase-related protein